MTSSSSIPIINTRGLRTALRYIINDVKGRYWNGKFWTTEARQAVLYVEHADAIAESVNIILKEHRGCPVFQSFQVPLRMDVYSPSAIGQDILYKFARKAFKFESLYANHGLGPVPGSAVLSLINWGDMKQTTNSEDF